ncbi:MAG: nucleoside kinase [Prevotella sp.]|nr:nucleoside kinase [Prevotella sp.]MBR5036321.1 nucleoside kinase [Prevotella sp.]MBR5698724.1 nucleoside kinase [Prevotella sp.]
METQVTFDCLNNGKSIEVPVGTSLEEAYAKTGLQMKYGPVGVKVNNKVEPMHYCLYRPKQVEYLDMTSPAGVRAYTRTLFFILCKAVSDLFPKGSVVIDIPVSNGYYCNLKMGRKVTPEDAAALRARMQQIIDDDIPIVHHEELTEKAISLFKKLGANSKAKLLETLGTLYTTYYDLDGYMDYFYGALLPHTGMVTLFDLVPYYDGLLLRIPSTKDPSQLGELTRQDKMFEIFKEHHRWQNILGIGTVGAFNSAIQQGMASNIVHVSEALQEKKIARIADMIAERPGVRMVLIAGPSSSGKTTTCKRLSIQLLTNGIRPVQISLDDYFVDRERTPRDEKGDYDYECLHALDLELINKQFKALFRGEEVELPRYNFQTGHSEKSGNKLRLRPRDILVVEGIHALNPELTAQIPEEQKFRVYASALTTILLDTHNYIPTTDNRLLRRIIRDVKYRGCSARDTIHRWPSVRAGENKWIFPYQENADAMFNTAMIYELAVIRTQAEPALEQVPENCEEYAEAYRLRKFLRYITPLPFDALPPTSLLREFLGGSSFSY